jgi:hypothetical protein
MKSKENEFGDKIAKIDQESQRLIEYGDVLVTLCVNGSRLLFAL